MQDEERMLNISEAAHVLGIHKNTLRAWADKGLVPHVKLPSGYRRFRLSVLRRMAREMEQGAVEPEGKVAA